MAKKNGETTLADVVEAINRGFAQVDARFAQVDRRFDGIDRRFDEMLKNTGTHWRAHERRITALERAVARLGKTG